MVTEPDGARDLFWYREVALESGRTVNVGEIQVLTDIAYLSVFSDAAMSSSILENAASLL